MALFSLFSLSRVTLFAVKSRSSLSFSFCTARALQSADQCYCIPSSGILEQSRYAFDAPKKKHFASPLRGPKPCTISAYSLVPPSPTAAFTSVLPPCHRRRACSWTWLCLCHIKGSVCSMPETVGSHGEGADRRRMALRGKAARPPRHHHQHIIRAPCCCRPTEEAGCRAETAKVREASTRRSRLPSA